MAGRNMKSYVLLSITMIMSFALLLGFFVWTDSSLYNRYKYTNSASRNYAFIYRTDTLGEEGRYELFLDRLEDMEDTYYYKSFAGAVNLAHYGDQNNTIMAGVEFVPNDFFGYYQYKYYYNSSPIYNKAKIIAGESTFGADDEVIINKHFYDMLYDKQGTTAVTVELPIEMGDGITELKTFKVVGIIEDLRVAPSSPEVVKFEEKTQYIHRVAVFAPQAVAKEYNKYGSGVLHIYSKRMSEVLTSASELGVSINSNVFYMDRANEEIRDKVFLKGLSAVILFTLLAINLYSCFKNALNERRFEIGVKRAVGARKRDIVGQFFREGVIVMSSDIAVSIYVVFGLAVIYKAVRRIFFDTTWTIHISPYSAVTFLICAFFLSVSFSLIFAYQSATVEIASQLKAE